MAALAGCGQVSRQPRGPLEELPLFPLRTVLFPGGVMPLRVFEPRYVDMVSHCMREGIGFGIVLIRSGVEARASREDEQPDIFSVGTEAQIIDFNQAENGLLGIVSRGMRKFVVHATEEAANQLLMGRVEFLPDEPAGELLVEHEPLVSVLREATLAEAYCAGSVRPVDVASESASPS